MYSIEGVGDNRVLMLVANASHRFMFTQLIDGVEHRVRFQSAGSKIIAAVTGAVKVYRKPSSNDFHREYMKHNRQSLWCGVRNDPGQLVDSMLEYIETL